MGLEKAMASGKERRKKYRGAKIYFSSCRNNGGCSFCLSAREHKNRKRLVAAKQKLNEQD